MARLLPPDPRPVPPGAASRFLVLVALLTIGPALVHLLLPDGGAGVIAGLDLSVAGPTIISLFAWAGATQLVWGVFLFLIATRYRRLVPLALALLLVERGLHAANHWLLKPAAGHHPPEAYAVLVAVPLIALFLLLSLRQGNR